MTCGGSFPSDRFALRPAAADRVVDDIARYRRSEHPERHLVRPPAASSHPSILRHRPGIIPADLPAPTVTPPQTKINSR